MVRPLVSIAAIACFAFPIAAIASEPVAVTCGMFAKTANIEDLKKMMGPTNVGFERLTGAEGEEADADTTVIYPKDKTRRAYIGWKDEAKHAGGITSLSIQIDKDSDPLAWHYGTLSIESGIPEIEAANGKPFAFSGFGWDYGGFVTDWKGGKLQTPDGGCHLTVRLLPGEHVGDAVIDKVSGEKKFQSSDAKAKAAKPHISEMTIEFP